MQYPGGGEVGRALESAGNELSAVADAYTRKQDEMDKFKRIAVENEFDQATANQADEFARTAPADGSGIHDGIVGEIDPTTGKVAKPGLFDNLAQQFRDRVPESQRPYFDANLTAKRLHLSGASAAAQSAQEQKFATVETGKIQDGLLNSILQTDPADSATYEIYKAKGREAIEASPLQPLAKTVALDAWDQAAPKALATAISAKDPGKLRSMLGMTPPPATGGTAVDTVVSQIIGVESGGNPNAKNPTSSASGVGQFLDSTWVQTIRQHRPDIAAGKSAGQILALKNDPVLGREMTKAFTQDNADYLTNRGLATTPGNLYLAHFLGSAGAVSVLKADPNASIGSVVGADVVRANSFLAGKTVADTIAWSDKKMGGAGVRGQVDPRLAGISPDDRLSLANADDVAFRQQQTAQNAAASADYTAYKDHVELGIVTGQVSDPQIILGDKTLNDGDKASLLRSWESENKGALQVQSDLTALNGNALKLDPYASDDKARADKLYTAAAQGVSTEQAGAIATAIIQQTGVVPQPIMNDMRRGLSSQNPAQVIAAAQTAQKISAYDPAILGRRDGGSDVQKSADDFSYYVNKLNLSPEEAARKMIDNASPEKQRDRKALQPAAQEFVKSLADTDLAAAFDEGIMSSTPSLGMDPAQEAGIKADFLAIAEDQFYSTNGDPALAKNRALEQMKTLYGVSSLSGAATVVKYPPERYWPKQDSSGALFGLIGGDPFSYAKVQLNQEIDEISGRGPAGPQTTFEGRLTAGNIDLANRPQVKNPDGSISTVRSMSFENDAGQEVLIPTVSDDGTRILSDKEAMEQYGRTGKHLGIFDTPEHATAYAEALHKTQERYYAGDLAIDPKSVRLVTTPETEADVKAGRLPGYAVLYKDANGNLQTIPGKVWRPDVSHMLQQQESNRAKAQDEATAAAREEDTRIIHEADRDFNINNMEFGKMGSYPADRKAQYLKEQAAKPKPTAEPGSNIPADIPGADPNAIGSPL